MSLDLLYQHIKANASKLTQIRSASACRENWLQGQLYLSDWGSKRCFVNAFAYPKQSKGAYRKADLAIGLTPNDAELIAEIKFLGTKDYVKSKMTVPAEVFWAEFEKLQKIDDKPGRKLCNPSCIELQRMTSWGVFHDYFRLLEIDPSKTRVFILVLDRDSKGIDKVGRMLESIAFQGDEKDLINTSELLVRAWVLS